VCTIYPGSKISFQLKGEARLLLCAGQPDLLRVRVTRGRQVVWDGPLGEAELMVNAGETATPMEIIYIATASKGFDPGEHQAAGAELHFQGIDLMPGSEVCAPSSVLNDLTLDFVGDSITAGVVIQGRAGRWDNNSDVTLTYAYILPELLGARYRIRAYPGADCLDLTAWYPYYRKGIPLESSAPPDYIFINLGANARRERESEFKARLQTLMNVVLNTHGSSTIVLLNFFRMRPDRWPIIQNVAASYSFGRVICFDARPYLVDYSDKGVHPGVESHRLLAQALALWVQQHRADVKNETVSK
jgi:hypothetical protein